MTDDALLADANLAEIARLRSELSDARAALTQTHNEAAAEQAARRNAEADNATLIGALEHAARMFTIKGARVVIAAAMSDDHPGRALLEQMTELRTANAGVAQINSSYLIALSAAYDALLSYAHGNSAPDLAKEVAVHIQATIEKVANT